MITTKQAQIIGQRWSESVEFKHHVAEWEISVPAKVLERRSDMVSKVLEAFPWFSESSEESSISNEVRFDAEIESAAGPVTIKGFSSLFFSDVLPNSFVALYIHPNVFVPWVEEDGELAEAYPPDASRKNRERLEQSMRDLEHLTDGRIDSAISGCLVDIDTYGIPEDARSVFE